MFICITKFSKKTQSIVSLLKKFLDDLLFNNNKKK